MTNQKHGVSALGLQRLLGLGSYQTAWTLLQKLRTAMVRPGRDCLRGSVEVDETYVGGIEPCPLSELGTITPPSMLFAALSLASIQMLLNAASHRSLYQSPVAIVLTGFRSEAGGESSPLRKIQSTPKMTIRAIAKKTIPPW